MTNIINYNKYISCFSSHGFSIKLPFDLENYDITAISFIRNPVDRFISHYYYHKSLDAKNEIIEETKNASIDEYIEKSFSEENINNFINFQFRELTCTTNNEALENINNLVKTNRLYLFPLDYFDESCLLLNNLFPEFFRDCSYIKKNTSKGGFNKDIYELIYTKLVSNNDLDIELYKLASREFKETISKESYEDFDVIKNALKFKKKLYFLKPFFLLNGVIRVVLRKSIELSYKLERVGKSKSKDSNKTTQRAE